MSHYSAADWSWLLWGLIGLGGLFLLARWHLQFWRARLSKPVSYTERHELTTADGLHIELRRLRGGAGPEVHPRQPPVLLVHGIAVNHRNNDPVPERSLARYLAGQGRDVWLLTLRSALAKPGVFGDPRRCFAAMCEYDFPVAVDYVLGETRTSQLDVGAFSMGGMVLYASLGATVDESRVRRAVIFGSPAIVPPLGPLKWARWLPRWATPTVPFRLLGQWFAFAHDLAPQLFRRIFYNPNNSCPRIAQSFMFETLADLPGALGADFVRWAYYGGDLRVDGERVLDRLAHVKVPVMFFAGGADRIAPPHTVHAAYEAWGAQYQGITKRYTLLSTAHGARGDYGHGCLAFGQHAEDEVFEPAARFLSEAS